MRYTPGYLVAVPLFLTRRILSVSRRPKVATSVTRASGGNKAVKLGNGEHMAALRPSSDGSEFAAVHRGADPGGGSEAEVAGSLGGGEQAGEGLSQIASLHDGT